MADPLSGMTFGNLRFGPIIGQGGMSTVYRGEHLGRGQTVAIKVIAAHLLTDPRVVERFRREATVLTLLAHPHIVGCIDVLTVTGPQREPLQVLVLDFIDGPSLGQRLSHGVAVRQGLEWMRQAALGLHAAHRMGIIHRDVKPDNILVGSDGLAHLGDFGLARDRRAATLTQTGSILGSPAYMAPEVCRGDEPNSHADVYALGVSLFQVATGDLPFRAANPLQLLHQHISQPPPSLSFRRPHLRELEPLVLRCLAKHPAERPDAASVAETLQALLPQVRDGDVLVTYAHPDSETQRSDALPSQQPSSAARAHPRREHLTSETPEQNQVAARNARDARVPWLVAVLAVGGLVGTMLAWHWSTPTPDARTPATPASSALLSRVLSDFDTLEITADNAPDEAARDLAVLRRIAPDELQPRVRALEQRIAATVQRLAAARLSAAEDLLSNRNATAALPLLTAPPLLAPELIERWAWLRVHAERATAIAPSASDAALVSVRPVDGDDRGSWRALASDWSQVVLVVDGSVSELHAALAATAIARGLGMPRAMSTLRRTSNEALTGNTRLRLVFAVGWSGQATAMDRVVLVSLRNPEAEPRSWLALEQAVADLRHEMLRAP